MKYRLGMLARISPLVVLAALAGCASPPPAPAPETGGTLRFDRFHDNPEVVAWFRALEKRHPRWFRAEIIGRSVQGRPIIVLMITDHHATGPKKGYWIDGLIHGGELGAQEPMLGVAEHVRELIAKGKPPEWLGRITIHLAPILNPDGLAVSLHPPYYYQRHNLKPVDDDGDGKFDEDPPVDVNGDGYILGMKGKNGRHHRYESRDADGDGRFGEDALGGIDLNRNYPIAAGAIGANRWEAHRPTPEPETRAVMNHWQRHPELELALSYHTSANVVVHPKWVRPEHRKPIQTICDRFSKLVYERKPIEFNCSTMEGLRGTTMEYFARAHGAVAVTIEMNPLPDAPKDPYLGGEDLVRLDDPRGDVTVRRHTGGYGKTGANRIALDLQRHVDVHVRFILSLIDLL